MKKLFIGSLIFMLALLTGCSAAIQTFGADDYYTQIQGDGESFEEQGNVRYEYNVEGYDEEGESMQLSFTANHELKEDAYLKISYKKEEVITYEEVEKEAVPEEALQLIEAE